MIEEQLSTAKAALVMWSAEAVRSEWVLSEANRAREAQKLVQVALDATRLPMPFDQTQCAELAGWTGDPTAPGWRKVLDSIVDLTGGAVGPQRPVAAAGDKRSDPLLAVLAFDNLSGDADMAYFSDGVSEEILQTVARGAGLKVIGRGSSFQFRSCRTNSSARFLRWTFCGGTPASRQILADDKQVARLCRDPSYPLPPRASRQHLRGPAGRKQTLARCRKADLRIAICVWPLPTGRARLPPSPQHLLNEARSPRQLAIPVLAPREGSAREAERCVFEHVHNDAADLLWCRVWRQDSPKPQRFDPTRIQMLIAPHRHAQHGDAGPRSDHDRTVPCMSDDQVGDASHLIVRHELS